MNLPPQLQEKIEKWASSQGISTEQFILQAITEKITTLSQQELAEDTQLNPNQANLYRKDGILVVDAELPTNFDINTLIYELREERFTHLGSAIASIVQVPT
ncbi:hypothetical protein H6G74_25645 [Nostoc spongiaeforme FACHB-130]|uniref:CopG family transcriptional regulator n=1 Tax=Nostoc spongiaeforme FACHB-130 TaxID=1357510 RepID=A0ABR8G3B0_9NOSO|nr:hypothetical protein [Nostoc spongiaeforme]MBD2597681.1 hypothetical protein [Nostoc spongiaeforme FACHB-130]